MRSVHASFVGFFCPLYMFIFAAKSRAVPRANLNEYHADADSFGVGCWYLDLLHTICCDQFDNDQMKYRRHKHRR